MVDTFSTNVETADWASVPRDLLPILSQPPYSLPLGGCDKIGNKSPSADWIPCWRRQLLAMSWHSSVSDVLSPYPPQPSPPGRGRAPITSPDNFSILVSVTDSVLFTVRRTITQTIARLKTRRIIPPLLGERAGVRADVFTDFMVAPQEALQGCRAHATPGFFHCDSTRPRKTP